MKRVCPSCREDTLFVTDAVYDGFRKTGETHRCTLCGHVIRDGADSKGASPHRASSRNPDRNPDRNPSRNPSHRTNPLWDAFAKEEAEENASLFDIEGETSKLCRKCKHYVVNPFTQRCMLHDKEVEVTDTCDRFESKND